MYMPEELEGVTNSHGLFVAIDRWNFRKQNHIPAAEAIIEEIKEEFNVWTKGRKFAPTIHALKAKLNDIKNSELNFQSKKNSRFQRRASRNY
jgi:glutamyl-tRNA reductase